MRINSITVKSIAFLLTILISHFNFAHANSVSAPNSKKVVATPVAVEEAEDSQDDKKDKLPQTPEGEVYKPNATGDVDLKKYRDNETKLSRPEKIKPQVEKPIISIPKTII